MINSAKIKNINKIKKYDNQVKEYNDILDEINMLSYLSHEIRNSVYTIMGFSKISIDKLNLNDYSIEKYLAAINKTSNYLYSLTSDYLDIKKLENGKYKLHKELVNISDLVDDIVECYNLLMKQNNINFINNKNFIDLYLYIDSTSIKQILNNLLSNAIKYTKDYIEFNVSYEIINDKICIKFIIKNNGKQIPIEFRNNLFSPFEQTNLVSKELRTSGLGLTICKKIVDMYDGNIKVNSDDSFTEFIVELLIDKDINFY